MRIGPVLFAVLLAACEGSTEPLLRPSSAEPANGPDVPVVVCDPCPILLFVGYGTIYQTHEAGGPATALTQGVQPAWSPDGRHIAFVREAWGGWGDVYVMNADGSRIDRRTREPARGAYVGGLRWPAWSPDGSKLAMGSGNGLYDGDILVLSAAEDGEPPDTVALSGGSPAWSPDGSLIAFVSLSGDDGYQALHVVHADGSGIREVTPRDEGGIYRPTWAPDGAKIAFAKCLRGICDIYSVAPDGSALTQLTRGVTASSPAWSPDGAWIAFEEWGGSTNPWQTPSIAIVPADGRGDPVRLVENGTSPAWRP